MRIKLRYLGVRIEEEYWMFGDNLSVVKSSILPTGKLNKRSHILKYHRVRQSHEDVFINFLYQE